MSTSPLRPYPFFLDCVHFRYKLVPESHTYPSPRRREPPITHKISIRYVFLGNGQHLCSWILGTIPRGDVMGSFWQDLRYAFRALRNSPWFAALAVVTLSLGIAVNTSIFSVVNGFILRPMPVPQPEQLAVLSLQQAGDHSLQKFSYPAYVGPRGSSASFRDI